MSVESWDPRPPPAGLTTEALQRLLDAAARQGEPRFGLDREAAARLAPLARHRPADGVDWARAAEGLADEDLIALIRLFTLAETALAGWEAADASPVIPLAAELRRRGRYPADLTAWIRANSGNRFLPYGNLMARL